MYPYYRAPDCELPGADSHNINLDWMIEQYLGWQKVLDKLLQDLHDFDAADVPAVVPPTVTGAIGNVQSIMDALARKIQAAAQSAARAENAAAGAVSAAAEAKETADRASSEALGANVTASEALKRVLSNPLTVVLKDVLQGVSDLPTFLTYWYQIRKSAQRRYQMEVSAGGTFEYLMQNILGWPDAPGTSGFLYVQLPWSEAGGFVVQLTFQERHGAGIYDRTFHSTLNANWKDSGWKRRYQAGNIVAATDTMLGGVKAAPADVYDTDFVHIDNTGHLRFVPGVSAEDVDAAVMQGVADANNYTDTKVSSVSNPLTFTGAVSAEYDGTKPVSVEIPEEEKYELIEAFTLDADSGFDRRAEPDGTPYLLKKCKVKIGNAITLDSGTMNFYSSLGLATAYFYGARSALFWSCITVEHCNGQTITMVGTPIENPSWPMTMQTSSYNLNGINTRSISRINSGDIIFKAGTTIEIWGVRE